ncbi:MAG TPA: DivIVA domain-containing protein [Ilumatobacteraceae bacterium]|nr:DivIVA domain-containing protein [Ilumatobacteraceae bacterium]
MDFSPQTVRSAGFKTVKKGYDPSEVDDFKEKVAAAIETAQNQATAMEARARAAVAKLQEVSQQSTATRDAGGRTNDEDTETISRTLLLAQRTADTTVAQASADAEAITVKARVDATTVIDNARSMADKVLDEARLEARRSAESERIKAENEVQALLARRDFLLADVDHLEHHIGAQRERLRDAAVSLQDLVERVPGGLGEMRRPLLSASADSTLAAPRPGEQPAAPTPVAEDVTGQIDAEQNQPLPKPAAPSDDDPSGPYEFPALIDPTPRESAFAPSGIDEEAVAMRLDLGSLDVGRATAPSWSMVGDDPLIVGDELQ